MKKNYSHYLIILGVCLAAYFQVAFLQESLKWDNLDSYLPMRYFVSECLRNTMFPLWLPYQGLGCPIFGDLISTNYPEAVFTGRLIVYDNIVLQLFFMVYIFLAGIGMYKLSRAAENHGRDVSYSRSRLFPVGFFCRKRTAYSVHHQRRLDTLYPEVLPAAWNRRRKYPWY